MHGREPSVWDTFAEVRGPFRRGTLALVATELRGPYAYLVRIVKTNVNSPAGAVDCPGISTTCGSFFPGEALFVIPNEPIDDVRKRGPRIR
ncbi:MAG TPA: hypothetical protein PK156_47125 [Polyangium sp.]|nr:hypothetical protein [Polyangium sp.]